MRTTQADTHHEEYRRFLRSVRQQEKNYLFSTKAQVLKKWLISYARNQYFLLAAKRRAKRNLGIPQIVVKHLVRW